MSTEVEERGAVAGQNIDPPSQVHIATEVQMFFVQLMKLMIEVIHSGALNKNYPKLSVNSKER